MNRRDAMLDRLPPIHRIEKGALLWRILALAGNAVTAFDEDMDRVQRSHWLDTAFDREDLANLGELFGVTIQPWEPEPLYRERLKATIAARLQGAVSRSAIEPALSRILSGALDALGLRYFDPGRNRAFHTGPAEDPGEPAWVEFPPVTRRNAELATRGGLLRSLDKIVLTNRGLRPAPLRAILRGLSGHRTLSPVLVNLTTGSVHVFAGDIRCGQELRLDLDGDGKLRATLGDQIVTPRVFSGSGFQPGTPLALIEPDPTPEPLQLTHGDNTIWFFPLAVYDRPSLGSAVLGMPDADLEHGRYGARSETPSGGTRFDHSLFEQQVAVSLDLWWEEAQPASFRVEIPAGAFLVRPIPGDDLQTQHTRLFRLLQDTVDVLRGAGICGRVEPRPLKSTQSQRDRVRVVPPLVGREQMMMTDRLGSLSAMFDSTAIDGARFS